MGGAFCGVIAGDSVARCDFSVITPDTPARTRGPSPLILAHYPPECPRNASGTPYGAAQKKIPRVGRAGLNGIIGIAVKAKK